MSIMNDNQGLQSNTLAVACDGVERWTICESRIDRSTLVQAAPACARSSALVRRQLRSRRGSVLVLVVGVLALLAIIVVVYTSIGTADAQAGRNTVQRAKIIDQSRTIGDYIAQVIADNATATVPQRILLADGGGYPNDNAFSYIAKRQNWDYPSTDPSVVSDLGAGELAAANAERLRQAMRFNPAGRIDVPWVRQGSARGIPAQTEDPRISSDPYLAATEPTIIAEPWTRVAAPALSGWTTYLNRLLGGTGGPLNWTNWHQAHRDWMHLSIVSPDGRVVNLANLRGAFDVPSGISPRFFSTASPENNAANPEDRTNISDRLSLLNRPASLTATPTARFVTDYATPVSTGPNGGRMQPAYISPFTWSSDQIESFRPVVNPLGAGAGDRAKAGHPNNPANQFADADGDGFFDSRWQELVDASTRNLDGNSNPILSETSGVRFFIAPRVIDLSGLVNVNTATTNVGPGTANNFMGITPADVDLERLLTGIDQRFYFGAGPRSYAQPAIANSLGDFRLLGNNDIELRNMERLGRAGFASVLATRTRVTSVPVREQFVSAWTAQDVLPEDFVNRDTLPARVDGDTRTFIYLASGDNADVRAWSNPDNASASPTNQNSRLRFSSQFGPQDEKELRTFSGVNDPATRSPLETAIDSRWNDGNSPNTGFMNLGPMRSMRSLDQERDVRTPEQAHVQAMTDTRHLLTTVSGARPLAGANFSFQVPASGEVSTPSAALSNTDLRIDLGSAVRDAVSGSTDAAYNVFARIADTFVPRVIDPTLAQLYWTPESVRARSTVFGGWRSKLTGTTWEPLNIAGGDAGEVTNLTPPAETAVLTAAHLTMNLMASRDRSGEPIVSTVLLHEGRRGQLNSPNFTYSGNAADPQFFFAWNEGNLGASAPAVSQARSVRLDLNNGQADNNRLDNNPASANVYSGNPTAAIDRGVANIFAVQPQPVLAAAMTITAYSDKPQAVLTRDVVQVEVASDGALASYVLPFTQDDPSGYGTSVNAEAAESVEYFRVTSRQSGNFREVSRITVNGDPSANNPDYMGEFFCFQVTNPFDVPLPLNRDGAGNLIWQNGVALTPLTGATNQYGYEYYIEFGGRRFGLADMDNTSNTVAPRSVVIPPRESVNFVIAPINATILAKWNNGLAGGGSGGFGSRLPGTVPGAWIRGQFATHLPNGNRTVNPYRLAPLAADAGTGATGLVDATTSINTVSTNAELRRSVRLFRTIRSASEVGSNNRWENDQLVDRLTDEFSTTPVLDRRLTNRQYVINGLRRTAVNGARGSGDSGASFSLFGAIRRLDDPLGGPLPLDQGTSTFPVGALPTWMLDRTLTSQALMTRAQSVDLTSAASVPFEAGTNADTQFVAVFAGTARLNGPTLQSRTTNSIYGNSPSALFSLQQGELVGGATNAKRARQMFPTIGYHPSQRSTNTDFGAVAGNISLPPNTVAGVNPTDITRPMASFIPNQAVVSTAIDYVVPQVRTTDLLTTLAIGPVQYPLAAVVPTDINNVNRGTTLKTTWTTLGEMMAFALDYGPTSVSPSTQRRDYAYGLSQVFNAGRLAGVRAVPFNDIDSDGQFSVSAGAADPRIGAGSPISAQLLDQFTTQPFGGLTQSVRGTINLNTAPLSVLRMIPGLTPQAWNFDLRTNELVWSQNPALRMQPGQSAVGEITPVRPNATFDIAATIVAYRDKNAVVTMPIAGNSLDEIPGNNTPRLAIDFSDRNDNQDNQAAVTRFDDNGRQVRTGISGLREERGVLSLGELLAMNLDNTTPTLRDIAAVDPGYQATLRKQGTNRWALDPNGPARLYNATDAGVGVPTLSIAESSATIFTGGPTLTATPVSNVELLYRASTAQSKSPGVIDHDVLPPTVNQDANAQMAIAAQLLNTVSVRSDIFCAYFLVHGYTPQDVEGLTSDPSNANVSSFEKPMTPSIQRRYMMVVDRSNVRQPGDKPKILMFEELPLR